MTATYATEGSLTSLMRPPSSPRPRLPWTRHTPAQPIGNYRPEAAALRPHPWAHEAAATVLLMRSGPLPCREVCLGHRRTQRRRGRAQGALPVCRMVV
jgi:hypothetical protein